MPPRGCIPDHAVAKERLIFLYVWASPTLSGVQGWCLEPMLMQKVRQVPAVDAQELRRPGLHAIGGLERFQNNLALNQREACFK
jgi:hypothetical protein